MPDLQRQGQLFPRHAHWHRPTWARHDQTVLAHMAATAQTDQVAWLLMAESIVSEMVNVNSRPATTAAVPVVASKHCLPHAGIDLVGGAADALNPPRRECRSAHYAEPPRVGNAMRITSTWPTCGYLFQYSRKAFAVWSSRTHSRRGVHQLARPFRTALRSFCHAASRSPYLRFCSVRHCCNSCSQSRVASSIMSRVECGCRRKSKVTSIRPRIGCRQSSCVTGSLKSSA